MVPSPPFSPGIVLLFEFSSLESKVSKPRPCPFSLALRSNTFLNFQVPPAFFFFLTFFFLIEGVWGERVERAIYQFVVTCIYAFIGYFLCVPSGEMEPAALACGADALNQQSYGLVPLFLKPTSPFRLTASLSTTYFFYHFPTEPWMALLKDLFFVCGYFT